MTVVCPGPVDTEFFLRSGSLPNSFKDSVKADAGEVVRQALIDSVGKKPVSVYGTAMKILRAASRILPDSLIAEVLRRANKIGDKEV